MIADKAAVKERLLCALFGLGLLITARCDASSWADIENLLGKSTASKEVAHFVEINHLNRTSVTNATTVVTGFLNLKESPLVLVCDDNVVDEVQFCLRKHDGSEHPPYGGKLPHGLQQEDTFDIVVQRLGQPTRQAFHHGLIDAYYSKLRLVLGFDEKSRHLQSAVIYNEGFGPRSRLLQ